MTQADRAASADGDRQTIGSSTHQPQPARRRPSTVGWTRPGCAPAPTHAVVRPLPHPRGFLGAGDVPRIGDDAERALRAEPIATGLEGCQGGFGSGDDTPVGARTITQIENANPQSPAQGRRQKTRQIGMIGPVQRHPRAESCGLEAQTSLGNGFGLHVDGVDASVVTDLPRQAQGVVAVAAGCVQDDVAGAHMPLQGAMDGLDEGFRARRIGAHSERHRDGRKAARHVSCGQRVARRPPAHARCLDCPAH